MPETLDQARMRMSLNKLLERVRVAFLNSQIRKSRGLGELENYYLIVTPLVRNAPMIAGFNWGAPSKDSYIYKPQNAVECTRLRDGQNELGSMGRVITRCEQRFGNDFLDVASRTNFCFFRSPSQKDICEEDIDLCRPLFEDLLDIMAPSVVLVFSHRVRDYLRTQAPLRLGVKTAFLPHPNSRLTNEARDALWRAALGGPLSQVNYRPS